MKPEQHEALRTLIDSSWFIPLVAGAEIVVFGIGLLIGIRMGG